MDILALQFYIEIFRFFGQTLDRHDKWKRRRTRKMIIGEAYKEDFRGDRTQCTKTV